ncbi:3-methyl-2-oxobutanoate hydroxymethyltransferase [Vampirovibrio chlorellavorus]|uniref:3-methyl-2-oxobutanoate hydroxymethyltransferase n=1 Tax=Vampirovibrio chlorellavorus TaxID=758823 RepID=UPI0026EB45F1|nr:3-methyl-2-oxobutanoate hydroxymethyltransferase [Vampirovibrio chlorellavorus]
MSVHTQPASDEARLTKRTVQTVASLRRKKEKGQKLVTLTCYDYSTARILDEAEVDLLLVGDSLAMTVLGHSNTLSVTVDEMLHHVKAVSRGARHAFVVADMPFMSYQTGWMEATKNAGRFIQEGGAQAVKLEGASDKVTEVVRHLVEIGIPVVGHLGFTPQMLNTLGGFKVQAKTLDDVRKLLSDALRLQAAGAFALVLEMVPVEVADLITRQLEIPTIGIGAGNGCDGQILVIDDLLGRYSELSPRFVRRYMDSKALIHQAVTDYAADIQNDNFPDNTVEAFSFPAELMAELSQLTAALTP